ncbi:hypothetical protein [Xanthomonas prunicola]|uniref:Uncharacterized protein n=1 Tax=Xanthomonas prunicola TaxID=2053930 RepID=A0A9Q9J5D4_9XANT|nr:hypothetical protein [Xanthomonas prunicola]UXA58505.1 hypothetical protein M0D47_06670 [Xanthomonas prunicola]UXA66715.1 hypothetical protein M0D43_06885 [Xanthomonas prunicola]
MAADTAPTIPPPDAMPRSQDLRPVIRNQSLEEGIASMDAAIDVAAALVLAGEGHVRSTSRSTANHLDAAFS